jgi:hypothetical protein
VEDHVVCVEIKNIDGKPHAQAMNAMARNNPKAASGRKI